jgi:hypothetical protein
MLLFFFANTFHFLERDEDFLKSIAQANLANRQSFTQFTCRFRLNYGKAPSKEAVLQKKFSERITAEGLWIVDEDRVRYELLCDPLAVPKAKQGENQYTIGFLPGLFLGDSEMQVEANLFAMATIYSPEVPGPGYSMTPFDMGWMGVSKEEFGPARLILGALEKKQGRCFLIKGKKGRGDNVAVGWEDGDYKVEAEMDPHKSFFPVEATVFSGKEIRAICKVMDLRKVENGQWFPFESNTIKYPDEEGRPFEAFHFEVSELKIGKVADDAFCIMLQKGLVIADPTTMAQLVLPKDEKLCLADIHKLLIRVQSGTEDPEDSKAEESTEKSFWLLIIIIILFGAFLVLLFIVKKIYGFGWFKKKSKAGG